MGLEEHNRIGELSGQLNYFCSIEPRNIRVVIDETSSTLAGFMARNLRELDHLYIDVEYQGLGLGTQLLNEAKSGASEGLELYTFQKNLRAQSFYLSNDFIEEARGFAAQETNPWASSPEDLADIKYRWTP